MQLARYGRFLLIGAFVGVITVAARELASMALGSDTPANYSISVVLAYSLGILLSFTINRRFTFGYREPDYWSRLPLFALIAVIGLLSTTVLSLILRYALNLQAALGQLSAPVSFAVATLCASAITYPLTALFVFPQGNSGVVRGHAAWPFS